MNSSTVDYRSVTEQLKQRIETEMRDWSIGGVACALIDDGIVVFAEGFGEASRESIFRVGSVGKLFTALAVMQQGEAGRLDLDAPVAPDLLPLNPFSEQTPVTLRQLLCHRSGLPREPAVGGYYDDTEPTLAATVESIRGCVFASRPGEKARYSNVGPALAGFLVERISGESFQDYQQRHLLDPLQMTRSAWSIKRCQRESLVPSRMRVPDGRGGWQARRAPLFDLGYAPSGNLCAPIDDMAKFAVALLRDGDGLLRPKTLQEMWRPQLTLEERGYGLGFLLGQFRGHRSVGHGGAIYGNSSSFVLLPDFKLAAIVLGNEDLASARMQQISEVALGLLLDAKCGDPPSAPADRYPPSDLQALSGDYESQSCWCRLEARDGELVGDISGQPTRFTPIAVLQFTAESRIENGTVVTFDRGEDGRIQGFSMGFQKFCRVSRVIPPLSPFWRSRLGTYGPNFIPFMVSERHGHLYATIENMLDYRLTPINRNACSLPPGLYSDEQVVFLSDLDGNVHGVDFANMTLAKKDGPPLSGRCHSRRGRAMDDGRVPIDLGRCHAAVERWPLARPFRITGYTWEFVELLVVTVECDGEVGRGEAAGVYYLSDTPAAMREQLDTLRSAHAAPIDRAALQYLLPRGGARNALDCALWDLEAKLTGRAAWEMAEVPRPRHLLTTFTCGADAPERMVAVARSYGSVKAVKLKLTGEPIDADRVLAVRDALPHAWLGVDANQGFTRDHLDRLMPSLVAARVALIEQPFALGQEALLDCFKSPIPVAADESVQGMDDMEKLVGRFNVVNIKLDKCGGLTQGLAMARRAADLGLDIMVGNMMGTSLAMAPAFLLGQVCQVVDLDGPIFLKSDRADPVQYADGCISCPDSLWGHTASSSLKRPR